MGRSNHQRAWTPHSAAVEVGVGRREMTPAVGIYARMWGAAKHNRAEGTHRPLQATALVFRRRKGQAALALVSVELPILAGREALQLRRSIIELVGGDSARVLINFSHTHAAPWIDVGRQSLPGGELLPAFREQMTSAVSQAVGEAIHNARPAVLTLATGRCSLATNRDLPEPGVKRKRRRTVCGFNPDAPADDTLLVGRITDRRGGQIMATLVNYACHPTTLAWENRLISPDYVGAMREVVERHTGDAPCLFLQGASGELAPAHQYSGDHALADQHGRQLGYAALAAIESMLPPAHELTYQGVVESGAPLAVWRPAPFRPSAVVEAVQLNASLPLRPLPSTDTLRRQWSACTDRALKERLFRKLQMLGSLPRSRDGKRSPTPIWVWRIGRMLVFAHGNEAYSDLQIELRRSFPAFACVVMNTTNDFVGYLSPPAIYDRDVYQVWQSPYDRQALPTLIRTCKRGAARLARDK